MLNIFKWLYHYYKRHPWVMFVLIVLTPVQTVFQVAIPRMIDFTVDYLDTEKVSDDWLAGFVAQSGSSFDISPLMSFGLSFILLGLIASILYFVVQGHRAWMNLRLEWHFRQDAFNDITEKGPNFFNKFRTGDIVTRLTDDVADKLSWFACSGIFRTYEALLMIAFTVTMMVMIDPVLTIWAVSALPVLIFIFFKSSSLLDKRYDHLQSRISLFNDLLEACFSGIRVVKAYVREKAQKENFEHTALDRRQAEIDTVKVHAIIDSMYMYIWQFSILIILIAGGYFVMNTDISRGKLGSFIFYTVWLVFPMFDIGQFLVKSRQSGVSIHRLTELNDIAPMVTDGGKQELNSHDNGVDYDKVGLRFESNRNMIVDDITMSIGKGKTIAIVGKVGSGKTWLINMIPRLVDPSVGSVNLEGQLLTDYKLEELRHKIGYVPQEPVLFSDTVKNNILMGREDIPDSRLEWAVEISQLKNEIDQFPNKLETFIGTRGMSISGGQKQRLALARALVGKPSILILDDCTSALDSKTEASLWDKLHELIPNLTAVLITHRPDTLERADVIYVIDEGRIIEQGSHQDLINKESAYSRIYKRYKLEEEVK